MTIEKSNISFSIEGRVALVTGAARGIGKATAIALAKHGADVAVNYLTQRDKAEAVATAIRGLGRRAAVVQGDVSKEADVKRLVREAAGSLGPIDILVNNAGIASSCRFHEMSLGEWQRTIDVDLTSVFLVTREVVPAMMERRFGRILNITSSAVKAPIDVLGLSNGARSGLTGFVAGLARQSRLASRNVTINNLLPGFFDTDRIRSTLAATATKSGKSIEEVMDTRRATIPARRLGTAQEFGAACAFLCSAQAGYITGQNWLLDGGGYPGTF